MREVVIVDVQVLLSAIRLPMKLSSTMKRLPLH